MHRDLTGNESGHRHYFRLTGTFGPGSEWGSRGTRTSLQGSSQQHADLILCVGVQVADLVGGLVHGLQVIHGSSDRAVLYLSVDDGPVAVNGVCIELDPEIGGAHRRQLRRGDGHRRLWGGGQEWSRYCLIVYCETTWPSSLIESNILHQNSRSLQDSFSLFSTITFHHRSLDNSTENTMRYLL